MANNIKTITNTVKSKDIPSSIPVKGNCTINFVVKNEKAKKKTKK